MRAIYLALIKQNYAVQIQYRAAIVIWISSLTVEPLIYMVVWRTIAEAHAGSVGNYSINDISAYYIAFLFVRQMVAGPSFSLYEERIRQGTLSYLLLRPMHPLHSDIVEEWAYKVIIFMVITPILLLLMLAFGITLPISFSGVLLFFVALFMSATLRFSLQWMIAMLGFWTTRLTALRQLYFVLQTFFGGTLAPIDLLPAVFQNVAWVLPFPWIFTFPISLLLGKLTNTEILIGFAAQSLWIMVIVVAMLALWNAGVRHYAAVGG
jgi:ABC-2 type transport system permease protein